MHHCLHIRSLAEWNVHLSPELQRHLTTSGAVPSVPADYIDRWLSSSIKVSPAITVCRLNHCRYDKAHPKDVPKNVLGMTEVMEKLERAVQKWLIERGRGPNYGILVTAHEVLEDVICIQIIPPCKRQDPDLPHHSLYQSKLPPPLDTWYDRSYNNIQSSAETVDQPTQRNGDSPIALSNRKGQPFKSQHAWRKGLWPPYPYGVVIVDRPCGEAVLRGADIYPTPGILCTDTYVVPQSPVAVYVDMTRYGETNFIAADATNGALDDPCNRSPERRRRRRHNSGSSTKFSRGVSLQHYSISNDDKTVVFIGIGIAKCSRAAMFSKSPSSLQGAVIEMFQIAAPFETPRSNASYLLPSMNNILLTLHDSIVVQNLPSMVVAHVLLEDELWSHSTAIRNEESDSREWILDMCCAPGGKTSHVASLCRQRGGKHPRGGSYTIVACDKSRKKIVQVREFLRKLGCLEDLLVIPLVLDSTQCVLRWNDADGDTTNGSFRGEAKATLSQVR
jgi:16S rRNA methyltransferase RsmB/F